MHPRRLTAVDNEVLLKVLLRRNTKITTGIRKCITWCINNSLHAVRMDEKSQELCFCNLIVVYLKYHLGRHFENAFCSFRTVVRS